MIDLTKRCFKCLDYVEVNSSTVNGVNLCKRHSDYNDMIKREAIDFIISEGDVNYRLVLEWSGSGKEIFLIPDLWICEQNEKNLYRLFYLLGYKNLNILTEYVSQNERIDNLYVDVNRITVELKTLKDTISKLNGTLHELLQTYRK